jgi:hypothetical protein
VAAAWRARYDRLKLNTGRQFSHLPKRKYPRGTPTFPSRDEVIDHLERHAGEDGIELRLSTPVERIDQNNGGWTLATPGGSISARQVVVAVGYEHSPHLPEWAEDFSGELLHSAQYRNPAPFGGRRVLVVGAGSSGMEIAHDVATGGAAKVWLSVRTPPNLLLRQGPAGLPGDVIAIPLYHLPVKLADRIAWAGRKQALGDLSAFGLPIPPEGVMSRNRRLGVAPAIIDREVIDAIKAGYIEIVANVAAAGDDVELADGTRLDANAVICATGYRRGLEALVGHLGVLDERGRPRAVGPDPAAHGLRFIGYVPRPAQIGFSAKQARRIARRIARELG